MGFEGFCIFGIQGGLDDNSEYIVLGDIWFKSFYSVFDYENGRIGLALHTFSNGSIETEGMISWIYPLGIIVIVVIVLIVGIIFWRKRRLIVQ